MTPERRGLVLVVVSAVSFGCVGVLAKLAGQAGMSVPAVLFWRWLLAGVALAPLALARGRLPRDPRVLAAAVAVGAAGYAGTSGVYFLALRTDIQAALASFLLFLNPVFVAALSALLLRERLRARGLAALALAIGGLALMTLAPGLRPAPLGVALALGSAALYSLTIVAGRRLVAEADPLPLASAGMLGAAATFAVLALVDGSLAAPPDATTWGLVATLALLGTAVAVGAFYVSLPLIGAPRASLVSTLEPVSTIVVAWAVLGEPFTPVQMLGGALVIAATALVATEARSAAE